MNSATSAVRERPFQGGVLVFVDGLPQDSHPAPNVNSMLILRFASLTNYKLDVKHAEYVGQLWDKRRT